MANLGDSQGLLIRKSTESAAAASNENAKQGDEYGIYTMAGHASRRESNAFIIL